MSYHEYAVSREITGEDYPFYGLIMAAMRQADSSNVLKLQAMWPDVHRELLARYNAPGGLLEDEQS